MNVHTNRFPTLPTKQPTKSPTNQPTRAPVVPQTIACKGTATKCECDGTKPCILQCDAVDSCKDSTLICPANYDCTVICGDSACNKAAIAGPMGSDFSIYCDGVASCGDMAVETDFAKNVLFSCGGKDSCKGAGTDIRCGSGLCSLSFTGEASGDSANIQTNNALGFTV